jgi:regulator of sigma E protease
MGLEQIQSGLQTLLAFLVVLGITITIHEFGHFAVAKLLKIRVVVFSLGFGPRLLGFTRGGTEYRISAFPLGGYVKMAGETFDEDRQGNPDEFLSHPKWHRFLVAVAGPFMNIMLAVVILTTSYMDGVRVPRYLKEPPIVGPVIDNSIARRAGLRSGDRILSVAGNPVDTWGDMEIALATSPKDSLEVEVVRNQDRFRIRFDPGNLQNVDADGLGFIFRIPRTIVGSVDPNKPAAQAGLKEGDEIVKVQGNGKTGHGYDEIRNIISESKGVPLDFEVRRGGETLHFVITPTESDGRVIIGFGPEIPSDLEKYGIGRALASSIRKNYEMSALTFKIIGRIFTRSASVKTLSGPLEIARISGNAARTGSARVFFGFIALVSLQLGVFNLLPIPILDGGVIALLLVEGIMRRDLSLAIKEKIIQVGFVFLILLMGFAVFNDLSKSSFFENWFR